MIDIICCNPRDVYYPYFMENIKKHRKLFGKVIIMMTQSSTDRDYVSHINQNLDATVKKMRDFSGDWRNTAINEALTYSNADEVLFLEQDFLMSKNFFEQVLPKVKEFNTIIYNEGNRFHPCFLLTKRDLIEQTRKDFSVDTDDGDHFFKFTKDLKKIASWTSLENIISSDNFFHLAGLTQNFRLEENFYQPDPFYTYLYMSKDLEQPFDWQQFCFKKMEQLGVCSLAKNIKSFFEDL